MVQAIQVLRFHLLELEKVGTAMFCVSGKWSQSIVIVLQHGKIMSVAWRPCGLILRERKPFGGAVCF